MLAKNIFKGYPVMLSASLPNDLENRYQSQDLYDLLVSLVGGILSSGGTLVFGGHPTITPLVHRLASSISIKKSPIILFQLARHKPIVPKEVYDGNIFTDIRWIGNEGDSDTQTLVDGLSMMWQEMVQTAKAAIFMGGKTQGFSGKIPGIREEYQRFMETHPNGPVYLLGIFNGETLNIIQEHENQQIREPNFMNADELNAVRHSKDTDWIANLVLADLRKTAFQQ